MKSVIKKLLVVTIFAFLMLPTYAQISFGLKGGTNVAEFSFKEQGTSIDQETVNGFTLGAVLEIGLGGNVFLQPEAVFVQKGSKLQVVNEENKINVNYLDVPILLKIKLLNSCLLYTSPSPRDATLSRMPSSA